MFVYRLARWKPCMKALVPRPILIDEQRGILVMESLASGPVWPDPGEVASVLSSRVSRQLGKMLADLHTSTVDVGDWPSLAVGILGLPDSLSEARHDRPPSTQGLMDSIAADAVLAGALREARAGYAPRCWIHGDLRKENWMLDRRTRKPLLKVIDWEMSGSGDPAWDIGSVLAEGLVELIREQRLERSRSILSPNGMDAPMRAFLLAYTRGAPRAQGQKTWDMVTLCTLARLLHIACECADLLSDIGSWPVSTIVDYARVIATHRREAAADLRGLAEV
jgi:aminoglycoside phosphotransferase (APT) family kinase protein